MDLLDTFLPFTRIELFFDAFAVVTFLGDVCRYASDLALAFLSQ